jgi:hypothetical protein
VTPVTAAFSNSRLETEITGVAAGGLAVGASIAKADVEPTITAQIGNGTTSGHNILVRASSNDGVPPDSGFGATADASASSGALVAISGADSTAIMSPIVESNVGGVVNASGDVQIQAIGNNQAVAKSHGIAGGLIGSVRAFRGQSARLDQGPSGWRGAQRRGRGRGQS